jgi:hypothetical protein
MATLIHDIEAFCTQSGVAPTQFGLLALNDKAFVAQLRNGRRLWPETEAKVRKFMAEYQPTRQDAA